MTFETIFKDWLEQELKEKLSSTVQDGAITSTIEADVSASNDLYFEPLKQTPNGIVMIISVGNSTQTNIPNVHFTTDFMNIRFLCEENKKAELFKALDEIAQENNGAYQTLTEDTTTYSVQMSFNKPFVVGNSFDLPLDKKDADGISETIGIINVQMITSVVFSDNMDFGAEAFKINIANVDYDINGIISYAFNETPNSIIWQKERQERGVYENAILTNNFTFKLQALKNDRLCQLLERCFIDNSQLYGQQIVLKKGTSNILISDYVVDKEYSGGISVYTLTLIK